MNRPLLILDLDETLIYGSSHELARPPDFRAGPYFVYERPFLGGFLEYSFSDFHVGVWTSAGRKYAEEVVAQIFRGKELSFCWAGERVTQRTNFETLERYNVKDLKKIRKLGFELDRVLMVDDSPEKLERNYGNHIRVMPFEGDPSDTELRRLELYLQRIRDMPNYRALEKRNWRSTISNG